MNVAVVMAYVDRGDPHRRAAFEYVLPWYERRGYRVLIDDHPRGRASGCNAAIRRCSADVIIQSDPDSLVPQAHLDAAARLAHEADGLVVPHDRYLYLTQAATAQVLDDCADPFLMGSDDCESFGPDGVGNVVVFSRNTWELAGGFDERFGLWGGDDGAFAYAAAAFTQPTRRVAGDVVHLWHPRQAASYPGHPGYAEQFAIVAEYRDAAGQGDAAVQNLVKARLKAAAQ